MAGFAKDRDEPTSCPGTQVMWIDKLFDGVLQVETPLGPRYLQLNFTQRAMLMWTFRNFDSLPPQVLNAREQRLIDALWRDRRFVAVHSLNGGDKPVIGRVERRPPMEAAFLPVRKPVSSSRSGMPERSREAASA